MTLRRITPPLRIFSLAVTVVLACHGSGFSADANQEADNTLNLNKPEKLEWLQDAGFGMFVHWSLDSQIGSVISHSMVGASDDYLRWYLDELPKTFYPARWDPDELARLAKVAGMRYVVFTSKHHNGFCWWDTATTDFKITNTPYGKGVLREYCDALRRQGLKVGFYYSPEDFSWLYRHGHDVCRRGPRLLDPDQHKEYGAYVERQVTELFTQFGPIDMLFIDGVGAEVTKRTCWRLQPDCLVTRGAITTPEQHVPGMPPEGAWESNMTMGTQWQYKPTNDEYKSGTRIIEILIETRAKGGSLMMNVGPKPNGELPIEQESRLREVALWHAANGESIHGTRPWVVAREENIWFTRCQDDGAVYVFLTREQDWSRGQRRQFTLQSVRATENTKISVLGHAGKIVEYSPQVDPTPRYVQTGAGLRISVVRAQRLYNNHQWHNPVVVKLENVVPAFETPPYAETGAAEATATGKVEFQGEVVSLGDADEVTVGFEYQEYGGFAAAMHNTEWTRVESGTMQGKGPFTATVDGLRPGTEYQYRATVTNPQITIRGDHQRVTAR